MQLSFCSAWLILFLNESLLQFYWVNPSVEPGFYWTSQAWVFLKCQQINRIPFWINKCRVSSKLRDQYMLNWKKSCNAVFLFASICSFTELQKQIKTALFTIQFQDSRSKHFLLLSFGHGTFHSDYLLYIPFWLFSYFDDFNSFPYYKT